MVIWRLWCKYTLLCLWRMAWNIPGQWSLSELSAIKNQRSWEEKSCHGHGGRGDFFQECGFHWWALPWLPWIYSLFSDYHESRAKAQVEMSRAPWSQPSLEKQILWQGLGLCTWKQSQVRGASHFWKYQLHLMEMTGNCLTFWAFLSALSSGYRKAISCAFDKGAGWSAVK